MLGELERAAQAVDEGDPSGALVALLAAWRACRSPAIAELIFTVEERLSPLAENVDRRDRLVALLRHAPDPRVSREVRRILTELPPDLDGLHEAALDALAALNDPALLDLGAAPAGWMVNAITRQRLFARLDTALAALRAAYPSGPPALDEPAMKLVRRMERRLAPTGAQARDARTEEELLAAIYEHPHEDAPRLVYADWLLEHGNEYGELIRLQLSGKLSARALRRHNELVPIAWQRWVGPLAEVLIEPRFRRGFVAGAKVLWASPGLVSRLGSHPAWATVEEIELRDSPDSLTSPRQRQHLDAAMRSLKCVYELDDHGLRNLCSVRRPWAIEEIEARIEELDAARMFADCPFLPNLRWLHLETDAPLAWLWRARWASQVTWLSLSTRRSPWMIRKAAARWPRLEDLHLHVGDRVIELARGPRRDFSWMRTDLACDALLRLLARAPDDALTHFTHMAVRRGDEHRIEAALKGQLLLEELNLDEDDSLRP